MTASTAGRLRAARATILVVAVLAVLAGLAAPPAARAQPVDPSTRSLASSEVHGFASGGYLISTGNEYLVTDSQDGSFQLSEVGINFTTELTSKMRFGVQLFAQNFGVAGSYRPQVDWFFLDYRWRDWLALRVGRLKIPHGLFNEVNDVDSARVPILLPQSVYPLQARHFLFAQTGAEVYGFARARAAGAIEYRLFAGTVYVDPALVVPPGAGVELAFNVPWIVGGRLAWETPLSGLRLGLSGLALRLDAVAFLPMNQRPGIENRSRMGVAFLEYLVGGFNLTGEYSRGHSKQKSVLPGSNLDVMSDAFYVMVSQLVTPWLQPALYYSLEFADLDRREGLANQQHDLCLALRFDLNAHWLVKLEGHYMAGTAGLENPLRVTPAPTDPARHWSVFLVKTTAYF